MADVDYLLGRPRFARLLTGVRAPRNCVLGLDVAGVVEAVGPKVKRFRPGDEVFGDLTGYGFGGFAELVCAREAAFAPKPSDLTFEQAATVPQAGVMAVQGLRARRRMQAGDRVLINGAGGNIGPFAVQIAKSFGAEVTGVDRTEKLEMPRSIGGATTASSMSRPSVRCGRGGTCYDRGVVTSPSRTPRPDSSRRSSWARCSRSSPARGW